MVDLRGGLGPSLNFVRCIYIFIYKKPPQWFIQMYSFMEEILEEIKKNKAKIPSARVSLVALSIGI